MIGGVLPTSPNWAAELGFLSQPSAYPSSPAAVETIETSMSWVFLTEREAYKIKKQIYYEGIDFADPAARRRNAEEEVRLNRRLAPDVYLGVVPLTFDRGSGFALGGSGQVVDWLVRMRRLPAATMLDAAIREKRLRIEDVRRVADRLASFLASAARMPIEPHRYLGRLHDEIGRTIDEFAATGALETARSAQSKGQRFECVLDDYGSLLGSRAAHLIDAHGDLRPEHVCLSHPPAIIDCLEFSAELRRRDPLDDLAYLGMECARLGEPRVGPILLAAYLSASGDRAAPVLLPFYRGFRALIRARIAIAHLRSNGRHSRASCIATAQSYLAIADLEIALAEHQGAPSVE